MDFLIPIKEILIYVLTFFSGIILGYLGHRYQIAQGKIGIQRERLIRNIELVEQFLAKEIELEYICYEQNEERKGIDIIEKELENSEAERNKIGNVLDMNITELDINITKRKQSLAEAEKKLEGFAERLLILEKEFAVSDIGSIVNLIDPSNQLLNYVIELGDVVKKIENKKDVVVNKDQAFQLRHRIRRLLDERIK